MSIGDFVSKIKIFSFLLDFGLNLFFSTIRFYCNIFAYNSNKLVLLSLHRLGDTIFTIPAIRELKNHFNKRITIVCFPENVPIYKLAFDDIEFCELKHDDFYFNDRVAKHRAKMKMRKLEIA